MKIKNISSQLQDKLSMQIKEFRYHRKWSWFWGIVSVIVFEIAFSFLLGAIKNEATIFDIELWWTIVCYIGFILVFTVFAQNLTSYISDRDKLKEDLPLPVYNIEEEKKKMEKKAIAIGIWTFIAMSGAVILGWNIYWFQTIDDVFQTSILLCSGAAELLFLYILANRIVDYSRSNRIIKNSEKKL